MSPSVRITIDRLVMEGYTDREASLIGRVLRRELRVLVQRGADAGAGPMAESRAFTDAGELSAARSPEQVGRQLAHRIYAQLNYPRP